ncbi:MAG: hypothetical protein PF487_06020 [Bacteroidales bacterium]|jgi:hypothetical protein|nr:hypothetical protein [Bacteroidales bacterium]
MENIHDWINSGVLIILSALIFFQNGFIKNMKAYFDVFKVDEVKKYVYMMEETIIGKSMALLNDNEKVQQMISEVNNDTFEDLKNIYIEQMGEEHGELVGFAVNVIMSMPKSKRKDMIENELPQTSRYMLDIISDIEKGKNV